MCDHGTDLKSVGVGTSPSPRARRRRWTLEALLRRARGASIVFVLLTPLVGRGDERADEVAVRLAQERRRAEYEARKAREAAKEAERKADQARAIEQANLIAERNEKRRRAKEGGR